MDRREFLEQMVAAASLAAASPLAMGAVGGAGDKDSGTGSESLGGSPVSDQQIGIRPSLQQQELASGFINPPKSAAPWVYWMWINVDTPPAAMTFDLEQMKAKGIAGFILYNSPPGGVPHTVPRMSLVEKNHQFEYIS